MKSKNFEVDRRGYNGEVLVKAKNFENENNTAISCGGYYSLLAKIFHVEHKFDQFYLIKDCCRHGYYVYSPWNIEPLIRIDQPNDEQAVLDFWGKRYTLDREYIGFPNTYLGFKLTEQRDESGNFRFYKQYELPYRTSGYSSYGDYEFGKLKVLFKVNGYFWDIQPFDMECRINGRIHRVDSIDFNENSFSISFIIVDNSLGWDIGRETILEKDFPASKFFAVDLLKYVDAFCISKSKYLERVISGSQEEFTEFVKKFFKLERRHMDSVNRGFGVIT